VSVNLAIKSRVGVWIVAAGAALAALPAAAAEPKIGVVDFQRLAIESPQGKAVMESMRAEFAPRERTLQAQGFDLILAQEGVIYNASASDITPAVLSALQARGGSAAAAPKPAAPPAKPPTK